MTQKRRRVLLIGFLGVLLAITLLPIYWGVVISFDRTALLSTPNPPRLWPRELSFFHYQFAFSVIPIVRYFMNTLFVVFFNTAISVFFAMACGYAFSKGQFPFKGLLFMFFLAVMMIPFEARMIPLFLQFRDWGMLNTYWPLILGGFAYSFGMFLAKQSIDQIPDSLRESAFIDGANEWWVFFRIILPLSGPVISALVILQSINNWNNFLWPLIVISERNRQMISVGVALFNSGDNANFIGPMLAVAMMSALPLITIFFIFQKRIVESVAFAGIKQ